MENDGIQAGFCPSIIVENDGWTTLIQIDLVQLQTLCFFFLCGGSK
jgi:hypothetical protein